METDTQTRSYFLMAYAWQQRPGQCCCWFSAYLPHMYTAGHIESLQAGHQRSQQAKCCFAHIHIGGSLQPCLAIPKTTAKLQAPLNTQTIHDSPLQHTTTQKQTPVSLNNLPSPHGCTVFTYSLQKIKPAEPSLQ